jgi:hypothetical protein
MMTFIRNLMQYKFWTVLKMIYIIEKITYIA